MAVVNVSIHVLDKSEVVLRAESWPRTGFFLMRLIQEKMLNPLNITFMAGFNLCKVRTMTLPVNTLLVLHNASMKISLC
jgi:hypothetical protein